MSVAFFIAFAAAKAASINGQQPTDLAVEAMHNFGACVVAQTPAGAREVLAMDYRSKAYAEKLRAIAKGHGRCAPGHDLRFGRVLFAGAMAEALLKSDVKPNAMIHLLAYDQSRPAIESRSPSETMALCTVLKAPDASARLFATDPATPEEAKAVQDLGPTLTECLRKDRRMTLNRPGLRAILALAAWRIATTSTGAQ